MENFKGLGLPAALEQTLDKLQYLVPTPIQAKAIPLALQGKDILGSAQTGTGKTAAFGIPLVTRLMTNPRGSALIMTPTRELAVQVLDVLKKLINGAPGISTALLIGGEPMPPQLSQLRARPRLIVGTPGRINDHLTRGSLMLHDTGFLVLDETDRMLDMGFSIQIDKIVKYLPATRQTLLFSATLPKDIIRMAQTYQKNPERVAIDPVSTAVPKIKQEVVHTTEASKYTELLKELGQRDGSIIVFVKTKRGAERLTDRLRKQNHSADAIHGDLQQRKRDRVIDAFRNKKHRIMVATDIAARGLDIPHIEHVINYDLPQCPEDYIHRIGRTARAGAEGSAVCLISPEDNKKWDAIQRMMNPGAPRAPRPAGAPRPSSVANKNGKKPFGFKRHRRGPAKAA